MIEPSEMIEPPKPKYKAYIYQCTLTTDAEVVIYAENDEEAQELLDSGKFDDYTLENNFEVVYVDDLEIQE